MIRKYIYIYDNIYIYDDKFMCIFIYVEACQNFIQLVNRD